MSDNLGFSALELKTIKATGLKTTASNVVETLGDHTELTPGDVYWSTSSMVKNSTGVGNTKRLVYFTGTNVITVDPAGLVATTNIAIPSGETAIPACKVESTDTAYGIASLNASELRIATASGAGSILLTNQFATDSTVSALTYRCNTSASEFCGAMIHGDGSAYKVVLASNTTNETSIDIVPDEGSVLSLFVNESQVAIVETKTTGAVLVRRIAFGSSSYSETAIAMDTTTLTGKVCDPFAVNPTFYGYKADGLYLATGTNAPVKVVNVSGITGIAVFTKYSSSCEAGYIYREAGGDCRDTSGKRTDPVVGTMVNNYNFVLYKIQAQITTGEEDPNNPN